MFLSIIISTAVGAMSHCDLPPPSLQVLDGIGRTLDPNLDLLYAFMHVHERSMLHKHFAHGTGVQLEADA